MTYRSQYRAAAKAALIADPRFADCTMMESWAGSIDADTLPVMGVVTASETVQPGSSGQFERSTMLQVVLKRSGGPTVEDDLDEDAAAIEAAVFAAIMTPQTQCFPADLAFSINGEGRERIGTVVVTFRITSWRAAP